MYDRQELKVAPDQRVIMVIWEQHLKHHSVGLAINETGLSVRHLLSQIKNIKECAEPFGQFSWNPCLSS
ncbi:hypothetical protein K1T71_007035 [Dendrolimus kikuchii]|uniref:Uncharacterized protein n=1 Tax=Dendrolimus kikuchii TaxID=765133 RepID=A0ACC1CZK2_9NEOP|nr:hypothetical protein K1T71_007035 [Dendrolimus kikuchii]